MRPSGRLQLWIWRLRLLLRKLPFARSIVRRVRSLAPDSRDRHLRAELAFWRRWLASEGLAWPEDYAMRFDPAAPIQEHLAVVIDRLPQANVEILDVGAGPVTVIGKIHPSKKLTITATDVLAPKYDALLDRFGVAPPVRTIHAELERLQDSLGARQFDFVHAQNSLDHCADPIAGVEAMLAVTRPGGFIVLLHEENEGRNELYYALHKWDFACEGGHFTITGPGPGGPCRDITEMLAGQAEVECSTCSGEVLVVIRRRQ